MNRYPVRWIMSGRRTPAMSIVLLLAAAMPGWPQDPAGPPAGKPAWHQTASQVHSRFTGRKGTFAQFGDSITVSFAFWTALQGERRGASTEMEQAYRRVERHMLPECWREWKGPEFGSEGGQGIGWARENIDAWLKRLNPETAVLMFGTNDLDELSEDEYRAALRDVARRCLNNGTIVILSTIPPRHNMADKAAAFADAARGVAEELSLPLVDYHAEILKRRPDDWDGGLDKFARYEGYDVPTLISRDGVHPSAPKRYAGDYSNEGLRSHGFGLRNYLTLMAYAEVIEALQRGPQPDAPRPERPAAAVTIRPWYPVAPVLPPPTGEVLRIDSVDRLESAVRNLRPGSTILLADGTYALSRTIVLTADGVTIRSESGRRERVVLDGGGTLGEMLTLRGCSGVTVADLTVQNVRSNGIKLDSDSGVQRARIRNCVLRNIWQRGVKGVKVPAERRETLRPRQCVIEYCLFTNDRPKRFEDDPADTAKDFDGNYVGGIDVMYAAQWIIRDNVFVGIRGRTGGARGAIFLWHESQNCVVERNIIVDCDSGICLGNSHKPNDVTVHCTGIVVKNNFVCRAPENGILADYTRGCAILHNTVHEPQSRFGRMIRLVHENDGLRVVNNLLTGPPSVETESRIEMHNNLTRDLSAGFVAPQEGNLRLTAAATEAIDRAVPLPQVPEDIDRQQRDNRPDVGAHEFKPS